MTDPLLIAKNADHDLFLLPHMGNRHGLITGATGTGKTVTLQAMAQAFSRIGVPVFVSDVKGDLSGIAAAGQLNDKLKARLEQLGMPEPVWGACPVTFWDVFGKKGHPIRATISDMGPLMLARMLELNDTQTGVLNLVFKIADDQGLLLLDIKDLRAMLQYVGENTSQFTTEYGNISSASIGAIQRGLLALESQGGDQFFGEPMLNIQDFMQQVGGQGVVNVLAADQLMNAPRLYATFLLWMLAELFELLPEVGDADKPKLVFFFDEAHLLFSDAPKALLEKIEQVVRLVRSKGVGVYFVTQNPIDIPDTVLGQLGNRVQHALRAFTPRDQKAVKVAATTMRANPNLDIETAISELGVGEALVSMLDEKGRPQITERAYIVAPGSRIGPLTDAERATLQQTSLVAGVYEKVLDRESAYEKLRGTSSAKGTANSEKNAEKAPGAEESGGSWMGDLAGTVFGNSGGKTTTQAKRGGSRGDSVVEALAKSVARTIGSTVGREIVRGILGSILGTRGKK